MDKINDIIYNVLNFDYIWFISGLFSLMTFESFLKFMVVYFFIVWIAIIIWVIKDIINRTNSILFQIFAILTVLIWTPLWIVVYLLIRPSKTLFEQYYEEATLEEWFDIEKEEKILCPFCKYQIQPDYKFCPNCRECLKKHCIFCQKELNPKWTICPYCWKDQEKKIEKILQTTTKSQNSKNKIKIEIKENKD